MLIFNYNYSKGFSTVAMATTILREYIVFCFCDKTLQSSYLRTHMTYLGVTVNDNFNMIHFCPFESKLIMIYSGSLLVAFV